MAIAVPCGFPRKSRGPTDPSAGKCNRDCKTVARTRPCADSVSAGLAGYSSAKMKYAATVATRAEISIAVSGNVIQRLVRSIAASGAAAVESER